MRPTDILSQEHRVIRQVLQCLEAIARQAETTGSMDRQSAEDAVLFFRTFADRCHHGKEEAHLFPAMEARGFSPQCGPTAVMRLEHEQGRAHVRTMGDALQEAAGGDQTAVRRFVEHALAYIALLDEHIDKEDHCLFSMANQALSQADQEALLAQFQRVEAEEMGEGTHQCQLRIADQLADRFAVPRVVAEGSACGCGH